MNKQTIEIEVPDGKKAIWDGNKIVFVPKDDWREIKLFEQAFRYVSDNLPECSRLIKSFKAVPSDSYELKVIAYRIVVAALTHNEKRHLTTGDRWYPITRFCCSAYKKDYYGNTIVGTIESEGERYLVIGGCAAGSIAGGLGNFDRNLSISNSTYPSFPSVSSEEVAKHISTYFGKLLFDVQYGGTNCNWRWID